MVVGERETSSTDKGPSQLNVGRDFWLHCTALLAIAILTLVGNGRLINILIMI